MAGLLASSALTGVLSLHLALDHHHDDEGGHAATFAAVLHGHAHDEGTPDHDHAVAGTPTLTPEPRASAPTWFPGGIRTGAVVLGDGQAILGTGRGPESRASPPPELHPILRI